MRDYADLMQENELYEYQRDFFNRRELQKQTKIFDKINRKYRKSLEKTTFLRTQLEAQQRILGRN